MDLAPDTFVRVGCVLLAVVGLLALVLSMVRFEQHRSGRIATLILGWALVTTSVIVVVTTSWRN